MKYLASFNSPSHLTKDTEAYMERSNEIQWQAALRVPPCPNMMKLLLPKIVTPSFPGVTLWDSFLLHVYKENNRNPS